jgi:hypothetical protein
VHEEGVKPKESQCKASSFKTVGIGACRCTDGNNPVGRAKLMVQRRECKCRYDILKQAREMKPGQKQSFKKFRYLKYNSENSNSLSL